MTKDDIKKVYDDLEDGRILSQTGQPLQDRTSYYNKILRSKPFRMAGKTELVRDVMASLIVITYALWAQAGWN